MSFEAVKGVPGQPRVRCICDDCGREEVIPAQHGRSGHDGEGQAVRKITAQDWTYISKRLRCPKCEANRKFYPQKETPTVTAEPPREATKTQKREIMSMLEVAYDTESERYKGGDTDETIAEALAVMPGWVRELREEFFGPDGGSADMDELLAEFEKWRDMVADHIKELTDHKAKLLKAQGEVADLADKLSKIRKAVGPRVLRMVGQ